jgi:hypothetical protein
MPQQEPYTIAEQQDPDEQKYVGSPAARDAGGRPATRSKPSRPDEEEAEKERDHRIVKYGKDRVRQGSSSFPICAGSAAA